MIKSWLQSGSPVQSLKLRIYQIEVIFEQPDACHSTVHSLRTVPDIFVISGHYFDPIDGKIEFHESVQSRLYS